VPTQAQADPGAQAKASKVMAVSMMVGGILIGIGMPMLFSTIGIQVFMTSSGFDLIWFVPLALMIIDFVLARVFWRRATALDRAAQGLPPRA
jgi:ABC-type spermidine/putrescine transport system permease subunit II